MDDAIIQRREKKRAYYEKNKEKICDKRRLSYAKKKEQNKKEKCIITEAGHDIAESSERNDQIEFNPTTNTDQPYQFLGKAGPLPRHNNVSWRGNSGMKDGLSDDRVKKNLVGGYYDAGDAIKFYFPMSSAMTMLSCSVIEYSAKYEAAGELHHVKGIIKWGTDYLLKTFNSSADTIDRIAAQVGQGDTTKGPNPNDHYCWVRPEDITYQRPVSEYHSCSDLAAEMAAALAAASTVFKDSQTYSAKLVHWSLYWIYTRPRVFLRKNCCPICTGIARYKTEAK